MTNTTTIWPLEEGFSRRSNPPWKGQPWDYLINNFAITQAVIGKLVTGVGFLALTWSTVVLLGGLVSALPISEFWFLTAISMVLASTVLTVHDYGLEPHIAAANAGYGMLRNGIEVNANNLCCGIVCCCCCICCMIGLMLMGWCIYIILVLLVILIDAVLFINIFGPVASMVISMMRLIQHNYDGSDAKNNGKLRVALFIFYSLALVHSVCFYCWILLQLFLRNYSRSATKEYGLDKYYWGQRLLSEYVRETKMKCANDLRLPGGWNLVTYAVGLLDSLYRDDHLDGLRMLDTFVITKKQSIRLEVLSSRNCIQNLITMLEWTGPDLGDQEMRERAASIVADVASALRVAQMPGALECISLLLEATPPQRQDDQEGDQETKEEAINPRHHVIQGSSSVQASDKSSEKANDQDAKQQNLKLPITLSDAVTRDSTKDKSKKEDIDGGTHWWQLSKERERERIMRRKLDKSFKPKGTKELIHQGLQILERLAYDEHNCREICNTQGLLNRIKAPITSPAFLEKEYDSSLLDILSILLRLVRRLISATGEAGRKLCRDIAVSKDNLLGILDGRIKCSWQLQGNAMEILTEIAIDGPAAVTEILVKKLRHIFLGNSRMRGLRIKAGEELVKLLSAQGASGQVYVMEIFCKSIPTEEICEREPTATDAVHVKRHGTIVDKLTDILVKDKECQISAAAILEHLCNRFVRSYELLDQDVVKLLMSILGLIQSSKTESKEESKPPKPAGPSKPLVKKNDELSEERKYLAALLSLLVVICDYLVDADLFSYVTSVNDELVKKLKKIIEANNENTADCLRIVKLACQVVIAIIHLKPSCLKDFNKNNFDDVLPSTAFKNMSDIENCMLFAVKDSQITMPARTLFSLVKEAQGLLHNAQETGSSST